MPKELQPELLFAGSGGDGNYEYVRTDESFDIARDFIEQLWAEFQPYADQNFLHELRNSDLHARFWEMYLTCAFLREGEKVELRSAKASRYAKDRGPDIHLLREPTMWIEAVTPAPGEGPDRVPATEPLVVYDVPDDQVKLQYLNALKAKASDRDRYVEQMVVSEHDPYVVAINGSNVYAPDFSPSRIVRTLFGLGHPQVSIDVQTNQFSDAGLTTRRILTKESSASVSSSPFLPALYQEIESTIDYSGISAVVFSMVAPFWFQSREQIDIRLTDDMFVIHNGNARNPLPLGWMPCRLEYWFDPIRSEVKWK